MIITNDQRGFSQARTISTISKISEINQEGNDGDNSLTYSTSESTKLA